MNPKSLKKAQAEFARLNSQIERVKSKPHDVSLSSVTDDDIFDEEEEEEEVNEEKEEKEDNDDDFQF